MNPAAAERRRKEAHPERFCAHPKCLWRANSGPCPKHAAANAHALKCLGAFKTAFNKAR